MLFEGGGGGKSSALIWTSEWFGLCPVSIPRSLLRQTPTKGLIKEGQGLVIRPRHLANSVAHLETQFKVLARKPKVCASRRGRGPGPTELQQGQMK